MSSRRFWRSPRSRMFGLVGVLLLAGIPAVLLRTACAGRACDEPANRSATGSVCSLPDRLRTAVASGFREGRSPDLLVIDRSSAAFDSDVPLPLVFSGTGVNAGASISSAPTLDRIAPTIASIIDFNRPHPEVRSGRPLTGIASGESPRLVLEVVWKGGDARQLDADSDGWPFLRRLLDSGAGVMDASAGSLPLDPAATMTTIGTGGIPSQHGITGEVIRSDGGRVVPSWGPGAPSSVIATLADDLDARMRQAPRIGLYSSDRADRGLIGGNWYINVDRDDVVRDGVHEVLRTAYGNDEVPDFFAAVVAGAPREMDRRLASLVGLAREAAKGSVLVVFTATGGGLSPDRVLVRSVENEIGREGVIEAATLGGVFLDQQSLGSGDVREDEIIAAVKNRSPSPVDVFPDTAITFSRFC